MDSSDAEPVTAEVAEAETVAVVGCGAAKRDDAAPIGDLYTSTYFGLKREYAEAFADRWVVLSAEHDLIASWREVYPYDTTIEDRDRRELVEEVAWSMESPFVSLNHADEVLLLAGREYASVFVDALEWQTELAGDDAVLNGLEVIDVFGEAELGGIGEQMGYLRSAIDRGDRQPTADVGGDRVQTTLKEVVH